MNSPSIDELKKAQKKRKKNAKLQGVTEGLRQVMLRSPVTTVVTLCLLLGIALNAVMGFVAWQKYVVQERNQQVRVFAEQNTRVAAANVANHLHGISERLAFFTKSSSLANALRHNDGVGRLEIENALKNSFPQALAIRLIPLGQAQLNLDAEPPFGFAEVEMVRSAERRERVLPEALSGRGGQWRFNVVVAVPADADSPVVGTILITLPLTHVFRSMGSGIEELGKVSIYQTLGGTQNLRLMGTVGRGSAYKADPVAVPNSPWRVEFTASERLFEQAQVDYTLLLLIGAVAAFTSLAVFMLIGLLLGRRIYRTQMALAETQARMGSAQRSGSGREDFLDVALLEEDEDLLGLGEEPTGGAFQDSSDEDPLDISDAFEDAELDSSAPDHIFRCYDIRGLFEKELDNKLAHKVGQALGSEALEKGESALIVARDARVHSPILTENLIRGILSTGCDVINIGTVPTPLLYFATETLEESKSGVMVTASHNPAEYNGFKVVMGGQTRTEEDIKAIRARILKAQFRKGMGKERHQDVIADYIETIFSDVALAGDLTIVLDAGNGVTGKVAPSLFEELGCEVIPLYCDLDGTFPNHGPDPSIEANLQDLIAKVRDVKAHLGVAFDGDGDRLAVVTPQGKIIWPDRLLMLFAKDILARNPGGDVVFDVKSSRQLNSVISSNGGRPIMWKTGHAPMRAKVFDTGALIGGEFSGHIFIRDRWFGFDDGMYAAARLIEIMSLRDEDLDTIFEEFPMLPITPEIRIDVPEEKKFELIENLVREGNFGDAKVITLDGLRAEFAYGWGLVRASNTSAHLTMRFEAETEAQIHDLKALFTREIRKLDNSIQFKW